ncbi:Fatty acyl-AMP ligase FadD28 and polyketide synthase [Mycolicibacterium flavescens]|nr:Fatty acyl-AMP ligase FadD28 and polyketide synthase [Mycolicibacterium flavescens]
MLIPRVSIDPTGVTTNLHDIRAAIRQELNALRENQDESLQLAWLLSFMPKRTLRRMDDATVADPDHPVFCSNLGDVGSVVNRLDGTDAEYATARVTAQNETRQWLERTGGQLILQSLRIPGSIIISVDAYQPGFENTKPALRKLAAETLAEFGLTGRIE